MAGTSPAMTGLSPDQKPESAHAASARQLLRPRQHRADRRLARSRKDPGPAAVDAAQERVSREDLSGEPELRRHRRARLLQIDRRDRRADRPCRRHHPRPRRAGRARAMRCRRRQECRHHLLRLCRGGRRQRGDAGCDRGAGEAHRDADLRSECRGLLQSGAARGGDVQSGRRRQARCDAAGRDDAADRHRRAERRHRLCLLSPCAGARRCRQLCRQRRK